MFRLLSCAKGIYAKELIDGEDIQIYKAKHDVKKLIYEC
ncbi:hypothetical protein AERO8C_90085 [Aeromonas veronii]|uniref:Uncharacterized protein n=1 Tax=Aeromonas veronii TaxID=654 RepID=A0A653LDK3_AERVE|nr:hypothetical protein AERO8C_90085 [Aeromonas veronii]